jgi:hypothetical protein
MGTNEVSVPNRRHSAPEGIVEQGLKEIQGRVRYYEEAKSRERVGAIILHRLSEIVTNYKPILPPGQDQSRDRLEAEFLKILIEVPFFIDYADLNVCEGDFKNARLKGMYRCLILREHYPSSPFLPTELGKTIEEVLAWDEIAALDVGGDITEDLFDAYVEKLTGSPRKGRIYASQLAVRLNDCANSTSCALCGNRTARVIGPELFLVDSGKLVCESCATRHAYALVELLEARRHWRNQEQCPF